MGKFLTNLGFILVAFSITQIALFVTRVITGSNLIEPFLFVGIYLVSRDLRFKYVISDTLKSGKFLYSVLFLSLFFVIGISNINEGSISNCYADFRVSVVIVFTFVLFTSSKWMANSKELFLKKLLWPIIIFDLLNAGIVFKSAHDSVRMAAAVPSVISVLMVLYLRKNNYNLAFILLAICGAHAVFSSVRNYFVIFIICYLLFVYFVIFKSKSTDSGYLKRLISMVLIIFIPIISAPFVYKFWISDPSRKIHTIERTEQMFESGGNTEKERVNSIILPFTDIGFYIVPNGLGWRNHIDKIQKHYEKGEVISSMDSTWYYLFYHYGFIVGLIINCSIMYYLLKSLILLRNRHDLIIKGSFACIFLASFLTQSTTMAMLQFAFANSMFLALINKRTNFHVLKRARRRRVLEVC